MGRHQKFWIIVLVWLTAAGFAPGAFQVYSKAVNFARAGQGDFAFMQYNELLRNYPASKYRGKALFATGEYYFRESGYNKAISAFQTFLVENPDSKEKLYALAYLLNIANQENNELLAVDLRKQIIELQQVSFIFRKKKEIAYRSPLYQNHKAVIHINKIELYVEGELLAKVSF